MTTRLRTPTDDTAIVEIQRTSRPWFRPTSVEEFRWRIDPANSGPDEIAEWWVATQDGTVLGYGVVSKMHVERKDTYGGDIDVDISHRNQGIGSRLHELVMERATYHGARRMYAAVAEGDPESLSFAERRGFSKTSRAWRFSRLTVAEANLEGYEGLIDKLKLEGIDIKSMAEPGMNEEAMLRRLYHMVFDAGRDIPMSEPFTPPPYEVWLKWQNAPGGAPEQRWFALDGDRPVGLAVLGRGGDDAAFNDTTAVDRKYRGRGIAKGLKLKTIEFARDNGIANIFTSNDYENKPMLAINIPMGYKEVPSKLELMRDLSDS